MQFIHIKHLCTGRNTPWLNCVTRNQTAATFSTPRTMILYTNRQDENNKTQRQDNSELSLNRDDRNENYFNFAQMLNALLTCRCHFTICTLLTHRARDATPRINGHLTMCVCVCGMFITRHGEKLLTSPSHQVTEQYLIKLFTFTHFYTKVCISFFHTLFAPYEQE